MARQIGHDSTAASTAATASAAISGSSAVFSWTRARRKAWVEIISDSCPDLFLKWNATSASATDCDHRITANDTFRSAPDGIAAQKVAIYSAGAPTYGTDFVVKGWE